MLAMHGVPYVCILTLASVLGGNWPRTAAAQQRATLVNGRTLNGRFLGETPAKLGFVTAQRQGLLPARLLQQVNFDSPPFLVSTAGPLQQLTLWGGERLRGEVVRLDHSTLELAILGGQRVTLGENILSGVGQPAGEMVRFHEDFESKPSVWDAGQTEAILDNSRSRSGKSSLRIGTAEQRLAHTLAAPLKEGRVELAFFDNENICTGPEWAVEWVFQSSSEKKTLRAVLGWQDDCYGFTVTPGPKFAAQRLIRRPGWRQLTLTFDPAGATCVIDQNVLAVGPALNLPLTALSIECKTSQPNAGLPDTRPEKSAPARVDAASRAEAWIDDVKIWEPLTALPLPASSPTQDLVWLSGGEQLFGTVVALDPRNVSLAAAFGQRTVPWASARSVYFRRHAAPGRPVTGLLARIEFGRGLWDRSEEQDVLFGAIQSATADELVVEHSYLGRLQVPCPQIQRLIPAFNGSLWTIDPGEHHLGDEIREEFRAPLPEGPRLTRSWNLETVPQGPLYLSLSAAHLEPAGPRTPQASPFREELAAGHLLTLLFVNDQRVSDLNQHISLRGTPRHPQRIRVPIESRFFKAGRNTIRLEQRPARSDPNEFDDFEFSNLAVEEEI